MGEIYAHSNNVKAIERAFYRAVLSASVTQIRTYLIWGQFECLHEREDKTNDSEARRQMQLK